MILIFITLFGVSNYFYQNPNLKNEPIFKSIYQYKITGAVKKPGQIESNTPLNYRQLFFRAQVVSQADLKSFDLNQKAPTYKNIFVPFRKMKIHWNQLKSVKQLQDFKINSKVADKILKYKRKHRIKVTWKQLIIDCKLSADDLEILQKILILESND
ncbi:hypothetical protein D1113_00425 [Mycoplasmopsis gallopavonis]|nr:hypothetical protein D1113_00425 [Mycoplasmopsis gallopavonis]